MDVTEGRVLSLSPPVLSTAQHVNSRRRHYRHLLPVIGDFLQRARAMVDMDDKLQKLEAKLTTAITAALTLKDEEIARLNFTVATLTRRLAEVRSFVWGQALLC